MASTNPERDLGHAEDNLCDVICLKELLTACWFWLEELTSAITAPHAITFSKALSVDLFISGEYFLNNSSSSWSDECRDSAYTDIGQLRWTVAKRQTVAFAENCNSRKE
jgi:hypothetical protein